MESHKRSVSSVQLFSADHRTAGAGKAGTVYGVPDPV